MKEFFEISNLVRNELSFEYDIPKESIISALAGGIYNLTQIKMEIQSLLSDDSFNWVKFAVENNMIWDANNYTNQDVLYELKYVLWETVFPEYTTTTDEWNRIRLCIEEIAHDKKEWLEASWLFDSSCFMTQS